MRMSERLIGSSARCQTLEKRQRKNPISCASGAEIGKWSERDLNLGLPFSFMVLAKNSFSDYEKSNRRGRFCWKWFIGPTDHKILRALLCSIFEVSIAPVNSCGCSQIWISSNKRKWNIIILLYRRSVRTQRPIEVGDRICWKGIVKSCSWIAWPGLFDM